MTIIGRLKHPETMLRKARSRKQPETQSDLMQHGPDSAFDCTPCSTLTPPHLRLYSAQHLDCGAKAKRYRHAAYAQCPRNAGKPAFAGLPVAFLCSAFCAWCCGAIRQRSRQQPQPRPLREPRRPRQRQWRPRSRQPSQPRQQPSWRTPRHALP